MYTLRKGNFCFYNCARLWPEHGRVMREFFLGPDSTLTLYHSISPCQAFSYQDETVALMIWLVEGKGLGKTRSSKRQSEVRSRCSAFFRISDSSSRSTVRKSHFLILCWKINNHQSRNHTYNCFSYSRNGKREYNCVLSMNRTFTGSFSAVERILVISQTSLSSRRRRIGGVFVILLH